MFYWDRIWQHVLQKVLLLRWGWEGWGKSKGSFLGLVSQVPSPTAETQPLPAARRVRISPFLSLLCFHTSRNKELHSLPSMAACSVAGQSWSWECPIPKVEMELGSWGLPPTPDTPFPLRSQNTASSFIYSLTHLMFFIHLIIHSFNVFLSKSLHFFNIIFSLCTHYMYVSESFEIKL
jgi:hypothetical protein